MMKITDEARAGTMRIFAADIETQSRRDVFYYGAEAGRCNCAIAPLTAAAFKLA